VKRILITGGFGYIGGRVAQYLTRAAVGQAVLGSRRPTSPPDWLPTASIVETQWQSADALLEICTGVDAVVHLAGMNAQDCIADPVRALEVNGVATARLLQAAVAAGVRRFVHVSTAHVYASPLAGSISERSATTSLHPYATSHRAGEDAVRFIHERGDIEGVVIRVSNSFGAPAHQHANCWMLLVNDLCRQVVGSGQMTLNSSGIQRRDFVTLTDLCRAVAHLVNLEADLLGDGLFNIGGAWAPTILEMAERIATCCQRVLGYRPQIIHPPIRAAETSYALDFRLDKLLATGFTLSRGVDSEIIGALEFCLAVKDGQRRGQGTIGSID
jgi:UDP-glucose 4-epimerase